MTRAKGERVERVTLTLRLKPDAIVRTMQACARARWPGFEGMLYEADEAPTLPPDLPPTELLDTVRLIATEPAAMTFREEGSTDEPAPVNVDRLTLKLPTRLRRDGDKVTFRAGDEVLTVELGPAYEGDHGEMLDRIDRRNAILDAALLTSAPSAIVNSLTGFAPQQIDPRVRRDRLGRRVTVKDERRRVNGALVSGRTVRVALDSATRARAANRKADDPCLVLPFEAVEGRGDDLDGLCWSTLTALDTDCLLTLLALVHLAQEHENRIAENVSAIARVRGWSLKGLDKRGTSDRTKRQRVRDHLDLLLAAKWNVGIRGTDGEIELPLLVRHGVAREKGNRRGREAVLFGINPYVWDSMVKQGRAMVYDPSLLHADPRRDDWAVRIAFYLAARWATGWAGDGLYEDGGALRVTIGSIVTSAGLHIPKVRDDGRPDEPATFRARFREALERLRTWPGGPGHLGAFEVEERGRNPLDDLLIVTPPAGVRHRLDAASSKRIAARRRRRKALPAKEASKHA